MNKFEPEPNVPYPGWEYIVDSEKNLRHVPTFEYITNLQEQLTATQQALDCAVEALKECLGDYKIAYDAMMSKHLMQPTYMHQMSRNISLEQAGLKIQIIQSALEEAALKE